MKRVNTVLTLGLMMVASAAWAANPPASLVMIPAQINYQGRLVTTSNTPYADALHSIDLTLYPTAAGGEKLWSERYAVQTKDGYFSVNLGSGGTGLLPTNREIWQVLWRTNGSPDTLFMALTVRTSPTGVLLGTPTEATPRQQFMTSPFAYRAHQSLYASKADSLFEAPDGIQTPSVSIITNLTLYSGRFMNLNSDMDVIMSPTRRINLNPSATTSNVLVNSKAMFVTSYVTATNTGTSRVFSVYHGISTADYTVFVSAYYVSGTVAVTGVTQNPNSYPYCTITLASTPPANTVYYVRFLGIRKGMVVEQ